jgi:hypothetical protein
VSLLPPQQVLCELIMTSSRRLSAADVYRMRCGPMWRKGDRKDADRASLSLMPTACKLFSFGGRSIGPEGTDRYHANIRVTRTLYAYGWCSYSGESGFNTFYLSALFRFRSRIMLSADFNLSAYLQVPGNPIYLTGISSKHNLSIYTTNS